MIMHKKIKIDGNVQDIHISRYEDKPMYKLYQLGGIAGTMLKCNIDNIRMLDGKVNFKKEIKDDVLMFLINDKRNDNLKLCSRAKENNVPQHKTIKTIKFGLKYDFYCSISDGEPTGVLVRFEHFCIKYTNYEIAVFPSGVDVSTTEFRCLYLFHDHKEYKNVRNALFRRLKDELSL